MTKIDKISNPSSYYDDADAVLADTELATSDKIELLQNWANELRQVLAAEEESMMASEANTASRLSAVDNALLSLGVESEHHDAKA